MTGPAVDAIVVGAGPNGLAAAITLARAGRSVRVYEAAEEAGGGMRTAELTLPGFRHDPCATIIPLAVASPFFRSVDLARRGVQLIHSDAPFAHPLDDGSAAVLERSVAATAAGLGARDGRPWTRLFGPLVRSADALSAEILRPVVHVPRHPLLLSPVRTASPPLCRGPGTLTVSGRTRAGALRRRLGARHAAAGSTPERVVRSGTRDTSGMPSAGRWLAVAHQP